MYIFKYFATKRPVLKSIVKITFFLYSALFLRMSVLLGHIMTFSLECARISPVHDVPHQSNKQTFLLQLTGPCTASKQKLYSLYGGHLANQLPVLC